jgi:hypothetical protein
VTQCWTAVSNNAIALQALIAKLQWQLCKMMPQAVLSIKCVPVCAMQSISVTAAADVQLQSYKL